MTEHTPGPWRAEWRMGDDPNGRDPKRWGWAEVVAGEEDAILRADRGDVDDIANVRLAAAAPDLLEALDVMLMNAELISDPSTGGTTDCYSMTIDDVEQARAAIAKARGEADNG